MCNIRDKKTTVKLLNSSLDDYHDHKEYLKAVFGHLFEKNGIGKNPDVGWCGDKNKKQLCFQCVITKKFKCLDVMIDDFLHKN